MAVPENPTLVDALTSQNPHSPGDARGWEENPASLPAAGTEMLRVK